MKKLMLVLSTIVILSGCSSEMTNEEIIVEKDKCLKAGMDYVVYEGGIGIPYPIRVTCLKPRIIVKSETQSNPEKMEK